MTRSRNLLILVGVFVLLVVVTLLQNAPPTPPASLTPTPETAEALPTGTLLRIFPEMAVLDIYAIRIKNPITEAEFTIQRDSSGEWTAPGIEGELDTAAATSIARTIVLLPYERSINILSNTNLDDYGFGDSGQLLIQVVLVNGEGHGIVIGAAADDEPTYYTLVDDRDEIFRVERGPVDFLIRFLDSPPVNLTN